MFNFLKKKEEDESQQGANAPEFKMPPPPQSGNSPKQLENFSKPTAFEDPQTKSQTGFRIEEEKVPEDPKGVSFEIPDFTEEDIDLKIKVNEENEQEKPVPQEPKEDIFKNNQIDLTNDDIKDDPQPEQNEEDLPIPEEGKEQENEDEDFSSFEGGDDFAEDPADEEKDEDLPSFEANDDFAEEVISEEKEPDMTEEDETTELPSFEVKREEPLQSQPKFISKDVYKKMMLSLMNVQEQIQEMQKMQGEFPKIETQLKKHFQDATKNNSTLRDKLIEIDKKIFS